MATISLPSILNLEIWLRKVFCFDPFKIRLIFWFCFENIGPFLFSGLGCQRRMLISFLLAQGAYSRIFSLSRFSQGLSLFNVWTIQLILFRPKLWRTFGFFCLWELAFNTFLVGCWLWWWAIACLYWYLSCVILMVSSPSN